MNWTEGALARHSRRKGWDKDAARQKKYFAKAKARKHEATAKKNADIASFVPDYIARSPHAQERRSSSPIPQRKQRTPRKRLIQNQENTNERLRVTANNLASSQHGKRSTESLHNPLLVDENRQAEDIATKRRKLLEKNDWTGVHLQQPILPEISWQRGRITKPASRKDPQVSGQKHHIAVTPQAPGIDNHPKDDNANRRSDEGMRIRIGSRDLRWSRESNLVRSSVPRRGLSNFETFNSQQHMESPCPPYQSQASTDHRSEASLRLRVNSVTPTRNAESYHSYSSLSTTIGPYSNSRGTHGRQTILNEPRYVVRSSPPLIHHPRPTRESRLPLFDIQSPGPEDNSSTTALVGAGRQACNRFTSDNIRWNTWLNLGPRTELQSLSKADREPQPSRSVTPGISHQWNSSEDHLQAETPDRYETLRKNGEGGDEDSAPLTPHYQSARMLSPDGLNYGSLDAELDLAQPSREDYLSKADVHKSTKSCDSTRDSNHESSKVSTKPGSDLVLPAGTELPKVPNVQDLMDLLVANEGIYARREEHQEPGHEPALGDEDEDEIWKRFVFDNNCTEISRRAREEAHDRIKCDLRTKADPRGDVAAAPSSFECNLGLETTESPSDVAEPPSTLRDQQSPSPKSNRVVAAEFTEPLSRTDIQILLETAAETDITEINSIVAPPDVPDAEFKFHHPCLFIGRLANNRISKPSISSRAASMKGRRSCAKRRRDQGRPDFRAMPNYDDDPIEESY
ncbi:hypothetical protein FZEAL_9741 [Fusarium zealandicum]|uniref:Uncharacterized protein n=1 Tax=Fusarium zealandicum TaxID=1053134 RepID=A0A8H4U980_9HYPO|nr:hypothetical protein FZEAL_9741 [Fusarium zealandicum]